MKPIIPSFKDSLLQDSSSLVRDYAEIGIDSVLNEGILKDFPIIGTIVGMSKTVQNIRDRNLLKNLYIFIKEINSGKVDKSKLGEYKERLDKDKKFAEKELGRVLILLDRYIDDDKTIILAKLFKAYINGRIIWNEFIEYSEIVEKILLLDIVLLKKAANKEIDKTTPENRFRFERLSSLGLIYLSDKLMFTFEELEMTDKYVAVTIFGEKFVEIINII